MESLDKKPANLDVKELEGILRRPGIKAISIEEMKKAVKRRFKKGRPNK